MSGLPVSGCFVRAALSGLLCPGVAACARLPRARGSRTKAIRSARRSTGRPQYKFRAGSEAGSEAGALLPGDGVFETSFLRLRYVLRARRGPSPSRRARACAAERRAQLLGTAADPVLGRSIYSYAAGQHALALVPVTKTGFSSRFANNFDRGPAVGPPARLIYLRSILYRARRRLVRSATRVSARFEHSMRPGLRASARAFRRAPVQ